MTIDPLYATATANAPVTISTEKVQLTIRGKQLLADADVILKLQPEPRLTFEYRLPPLPQFGFLLMDDVGSIVSIPSRDVSLKVFVTSLKSGTSGTEGVFVPIQEPITASSSNRKRVKSIIFHLLNFPEFFSRNGDIIERDPRGGGQRLGCVVLNSGDWNVTIQALSNTNSLEKELRTFGGYAITHVGLLERQSGHTFSKKDATSLIGDLQLFLSFCRGAFTSVVLPVGTGKSGQSVWERWGAGLTAPWRYTPSWFDRLNGQVLPKVYPGLQKQLNSKIWESALRKALYWYLRSNSTSGPGVDGGLILTQAALELISYVYLVHCLGVKTDNQFKRYTTSANLQEALRRMQIPTSLPWQLKELRALSRMHSWSDGPHALTEVRNDLVHPRQKYRNGLSGGIYESWSLGQWYIELMVLKLCGYKGIYGNRLTQKRTGQVVKVPWT